MIGHIPRNTRIFIGLAIITLLLTYLAVFLTDYNRSWMLSRSGNVWRHSNSNAQFDTDGWQEYKDSRYPISFMFPSGWNAETYVDEEDFYTISLDAPEESRDIHIYVSKEGYFGLDGLNEKPYAVDQAQGHIVNGGLIGVKKGEYYYTFDGSMNPKLAAEFNKLIKTVKLR